MLLTLERILTQLGNLVTILTALVAVITWFDVPLIRSRPLSNGRTAVGAVILFCFLSSYGTCQTLAIRRTENKDLLLVWFLSMFAYVFACWFLSEKLLSPDRFGVMMNFAIVCNIALFVIIYGVTEFRCRKASRFEFLLGPLSDRFQAATVRCALHGLVLIALLLLLAPSDTFRP